MAWKVIADALETGPLDSAVGRGQWGVEGEHDPEPDLADLPHRARLYDDDGELYYIVAFDDNAYERDEEWGGLYECYRWGMYWAGATDLRTRYRQSTRYGGSTSLYG